MTPEFSGRTKLLYFALAKWAFGVPVFYATSCYAARSGGRNQISASRNRKPFPLGSPCDCRASKLTAEKDIFDPMHLSPLCYHARQAEKAKLFATTNTSWAYAYAPKRATFCQNEKPRRLLKSRREAGGSKGEHLGSFLGYFLGKAKK
jgi:hypothetical protein